jgi:gliding motility associated protien GldN
MFAVPGETLISIIIESIKKGKLIAYKDEKFTSRLTYSQVMKQFSDSEIVSTYDDQGQELGTKTIFKDFNPDSVTMYALKEDIYFDKTRGRLITQMIGLAPVKKLKTSSGEFIGNFYPFWLYFPQCRVPFAGREIYDTQRDIYNVSYDDIFIQRQFRTRIIKESNPLEMSIRDKFPNDEAKQIAESDRIEREIEAFKKTIWKY